MLVERLPLGEELGRRVAGTLLELGLREDQEVARELAEDRIGKRGSGRCVVEGDPSVAERSSP